VFDGEGLATARVKGFDMPSLQPMNQEECGVSQSTPTAFARSSHMQSCDVHSSAQHTPTSTAVVPIAGTLQAAPCRDRMGPIVLTSLHERKQQMQWPLVKGLMESQSPATPGSQKAGPFCVDDSGAGGTNLHGKPDSGSSVTNWEPLPCAPSQIITGYVFVIEAPVVPKFRSKEGDGDPDSLWPSITAVELNAEGIRAICKAKGKEIRHDASLNRTDSMDALVQVHVMPGGVSELAEAINADELHGPIQSSNQANWHKKAHDAATVGSLSTPWASGKHAVEMMHNLGIELSLAPSIGSLQPSVPGSRVQAPVQSLHGCNDSDDQPHESDQSPDGRVATLATPKAFSQNHSIFSISQPATPFDCGLQHANPRDNARAADAQVSHDPIAPSEQSSVSEPAESPAQKNNVKRPRPRDIHSIKLVHNACSLSYDTKWRLDEPTDAMGYDVSEDAASMDFDQSSSALSDSESYSLQHSSSSSTELRKSATSLFTHTTGRRKIIHNSRLATLTSTNSSKETHESIDLAFFLPLPPSPAAH
jgi:hypothetical protein